MKRFLLICLVMMFSSLGANATWEIHYNNAGHPTHYSTGMGYRRSVNHRLGENAIFTPENCRRAAVRMHKREFAKTLAQRGDLRFSQPRGRIMPPPAPMERPMSRYDKNYRISTQKAVTRNGITTYFN